MTERADLKPDYYDLLEVNPRARREVIDASFNALRRVYAGDITQKEELKKARDILVDSQKREEYDNQRNLAEGSVVNNYKVLEILREDDFVRSYKAEQVFAKELVTLKQCIGVAPEDDARLINEAKAVWNIRHYSLPIMRDLFRLDDGSLALIQSFTPGVSIKEAVGKLETIDAESVCWIAERVLNGLALMHINGVIHSGLNPDIIIVEDKDHLAGITDFRFSVIDPIRNPGAKGAFPFFAAPEQIVDPLDPLKPPLLPETDYYSLGKVMIYALSGSLPFTEKNKISDSCPEPLKDFIERLTKIDVRERIQFDDNPLGLLAKVREKSFGRVRSDMKPLSSGS